MNMDDDIGGVFPLKERKKKEVTSHDREEREREGERDMCLDPLTVFMIRGF